MLPGFHDDDDVPDPPLADSMEHAALAELDTRLAGSHSMLQAANQVTKMCKTCRMKCGKI